MVKVIWSKVAIKQLTRIDTRYQKTIKQKVSSLTDFPLVDLDIPYGFQDASRRQGSESPGA